MLCADNGQHCYLDTANGGRINAQYQTVRQNVADWRGHRGHNVEEKSFWSEGKTCQSTSG